MLCGYPPFEGESNVAIQNKIKTSNVSFSDQGWEGASEDVKDLLSRLLNKDPDLRISAEDCLKHSWFEKMVGEETVDQKIVAKALDNLKNFNNKNKLKTATLGFMVQHLLNQKDLEELESVFNQLDKNGNGSLSKEELIDGYRKIYGEKFNEKEVEALIDMADSDGSGEINYSEWLMTVVSREKLLSQEKMESVFRIFDKDKSETISVEELKCVLGIARPIDQEIITKTLQEVDREGKGEITFSEFRHLMEIILE